MIRIRVKRDKSGQIASLTINGHAGYAEKGQDIVCAAVSAISIGTINAVEAVLGVRLPTEVHEDGFLSCHMPSLDDGQLRDKVQLLLEAMIAALRSVEAEYGRHVQVMDERNG